MKFAEISNHSGIDPIAYTKRYGQPQYAARQLLSSSAWATLGIRCDEEL